MIPHIQTHSGLMMPISKPEPWHIQLADIAHSLSRIQRFGGHTLQPWSVAQHSLLVLQLMDPEKTSPDERLAALMHDAHEAYLGDITSPVAQALRGHQEAGPLEGLKVIFDTAIAARLGLDPILFRAPPVQLADRQALAVEHELLMSKLSQPWPDLPPLPSPLPTLYKAPPAAVVAEFLREAATLLLARHGLPSPCCHWPGATNGRRRLEMTDTTRLATLEAALRDADRDLEALRQMLTKPPIENPSRAAVLVTLGKARSALDRAVGIAFHLDALPADPAPAEVVEVRGCVGVDGPSVYAYGAKRADETDDGLADQIRSAGYEPVCFFTVHAPTKVVIPDAPASTTPSPLVKGDGA